MGKQDIVPEGLALVTMRGWPEYRDKLQAAMEARKHSIVGYELLLGQGQAQRCYYVSQVLHEFAHCFSYCFLDLHHGHL
jgi:hypothetical protein